jgi:hypothetical protein
VTVLVAGEVPAVAAPSPAEVSREKVSWLGVRVVGEVGFGQSTLPAVPAVQMAGGRGAALAIGLGFEAEGWVRPQVGLGLRVTSGFYEQLAQTFLSNDYTLIEPQVLWRTAPSSFGPRKLLAASWRFSAGAGIASVDTAHACGKRCNHVYAHAYRLSTSASTGGLLSIGRVALYAGLRFALDTSVDWSTSLDAGAGVEF